MSEKILKGRSVQKHDIEANWRKATNFIPKQGEIIIYDKDENYTYERIKIGDGVTLVNNLPFYAGSWNDLTDKPFEEKLILTEIFGSTTVTDVNNQLTSLIPLEVDKEYMVEWDGIEYRCKCSQGNSDGIVGLFLGNAYFLTQNPDMNTGEPFILGTVPNTVSIVVSPSGGTHTFKISSITADITPLDNKFIDAEWMAKPKTIEVLPKTSITLDTFLPMAEIPAFDLVLGEKYILILDDVEFEAVAYSDESSEAEFVLTVTTESGKFAVAKRNDSYLAISENDSHKGTTHTVAIKQEAVPKLPTKYLPEHLQFGETEEIGEITIEWDGNTEGLTQVGSMYKISDKIFTDEEAKSATIQLNTGETLAMKDYWDMMVENGYVTESGIFMEGAILIREPNTVFMDSTFPEVGLYVVCSGPDSYVSKVTYIGETTVIKPLDEKYLPDHTHSISDIQGLDSLKVEADSALSSTSENPVQNKVITAVVDDLSDLIGDTSVSDQISTAMDAVALKENGQYAITTAGDGVAYTAIVPSVTALTVGASFIMIPHVVSASTTPTLNVNGLGAKEIKRRLGNLATSLQAGYTDTWLAVGKPFRVTYDGAVWVVEGHEKPTAADMYGTLGITKGGTGATNAADARENLGVYSKEDHEWVQIYDSGEITASVNAFANIDIAGYRKLMVAIKCVNNDNNLSTKQGTATFVSENGTVYQFPVWSSMFSGSTDITGGMGWFDIMDGWIICSNASRNLKAINFLNSAEGGTADNLAGIGGGMMKCTSPLLTMMISALDQDVDYHFDAGSRVIVWGGMA